MAFIPFKEVPTHNLRTVTLANAVGSSALTVKNGVAIQPGATGHTKYATVAGTTNPVLGVVLGINNAIKQITEVTSIVGTNGTLGTNNPLANVYNDNESNTAPWKVTYIPSNLPIDYVADLSAAATSDALGHISFAIASGGATLDASTTALFSTTLKVFWSYGTVTDPVSNTSQVTGHWTINGML